MQQVVTVRIAQETDMDAVFALRHEVFVVEQQVAPALERDGEDAHAMHLLAERDGIVVGCARMLLHAGDAHIGRLAVRSDLRGQGIGADILRYIIAYCTAQGCTRVWLNAQCHAIGFYEKLGFHAEGESFLDAGIPHMRMVL